MEDKIIKELINKIKDTNLDKSSHWEKYLNEKSNFKNKFHQMGFGSYTIKSYKNILHYFLKRIIFGKEIFKSETHKKYKYLFDKKNRYIDLDTIRHIFTFELLKKYIYPKKICIIGDGQANGVLGAHLIFPNATIFSINLSETLINDYIIIKELDFKLYNSTKLVDKLDFNINDSKLFLIPSDLKDFLRNKKIDIFINIASFQEMKVEEINRYFNIIKSNNSKLYCCNREYKKLIGGEELYFNKYPWENGKIIFWEECPWHQKLYSEKPPFIINYNGKMIHSLIDYS